MKYTRENREVTYIHYGAKEFDPTIFTEPMNEPGWLKPQGHTGFWASPIDAGYGWKSWCEDNDFRECLDEVSFKFTVRDPEKIFYIDSLESYMEFLKQYGSKAVYPSVLGIDRLHSIDFERMMEDGWDGLEISLTDYPHLYDLFYTWDCDSILIFNKHAIIPIDTEEKEVTIHDEFEAAIEGDSLGSGIFGEWEALLSLNQFT